MAAASFHHHHPHQKRGGPQQSNSVPSTPHQQPRDLRFHSRSPSPSKTLGNNSPLSSASEVVGTPTAPRTTQPQFCKFETGAEFRKRRIIYTEGGGDPLPPPKEEPKPALESDQDGKLSGDMRELYDRLLPSDESEERRAKLVQKLEDILNGEWPGNNIKVNVFGSSGNLLSSSDSDVDVCVTTPLKALESMHTLAAVLHKHGMDKVICRASAKVPIVKIWDPELQLACDLNVNNPLALENTRMIKTYVQMDDRIRPLAKIIKYWTKRRILNDAAFGGTISSYTWICMIINFLQTRDPPILPSLQKMPNTRRTEVNGVTAAFADNLDELRHFGKDNHETLGQLIFHFFRHYGYVFDYADYVVSVKEGRLLPRKEKGWDTTNYMDKEARSRLCVEEPFNTQRNLGNSADDYAFTGIHQEIRRAFELLKDGAGLEECCAQYEFPVEEKPIFQRPPPKPKPVLTRSASQSGRPVTISTPGRGGNTNGSRNNRNSSNQRSNRRSSSGTAYGNQRMPYVMSPPVGINPSEYFATNGMSTDQLHNQLYKQYQFLQAQQEALRNQLLQQQQQTQAQMQQAQVQARGVDMASSPRSRQFANGIPSPLATRTFENSPNTAPLLPGYLYHYPARYPPPSPLSQSRNHEETAPSPSSPSLQNATPSLRRGVHRGSLTEGTSSAANRSQSQPGRSFPNPLTIQGLAHPGYDVSGAIAAPYSMSRSMQSFSPIQHNGSSRQSNGAFSAETAMPKEYVGYYVGQSPQLLPQFQNSLAQIPVPHLRDVPSRIDRRISPDLAIPVSNGLRHQSRSPSPLPDRRRQSTASAVSASQQTSSQPKNAEHSGPIIASSGPVIVNGSNMPSTRPRQSSTSIPVSSVPETYPACGELEPDMIPTEQIQQMSLDSTFATSNGHQYDVAQGIPQHSTGYANGQALHSGSPMQYTGPHVQQNGSAAYESAHMSVAAMGMPHRMSPSHAQDTNTRYDDEPAHVSPPSFAEAIPSLQHNSTAPLLSPVAEIRSPSPAMGRIAAPPKSSHKLAQNVQIANGRTAQAANKSQQGNSGNQTRTEGKYQPPIGNGAGNSWQQAPSRKGHKKTKSTGSKGKTGGGEPLPVNEADRKGG